MIFYMAAPQMHKIGRALAFEAFTVGQFSDYVDYAGSPKYCAVIRGYAKVVVGEDDEVFFMSNDTPYVVWHEPGANVRTRCIMKLDLQNPQECEEMVGTAKQTLDAVMQRIKEHGVPNYPTDDVGKVIRRHLRRFRGR